MLTRPLAYKGPTDHLTQHFELRLLFAGSQILSQDGLMDWRLLKEDNLAQGIFFYQSRLIKTVIGWPLSYEAGINSCACQNENENQGENANTASTEPCEHMAALAIETKAQLDRLPHSLKPNETFHSEWQYLTDWLSLQQHDPFPNMARHRVIYILDGDEERLEVCVFKAYLTQANEYQKKAELEIDGLNKTKLPKFISLTDQQIIQSLNALAQSEPARQSADFAFTLYSRPAQAELTDQTDQTDQSEQPAQNKVPTINMNPAAQQLVKLMVNSGRCFWRACHRQPLSYQQATRFKSSWLNLDSPLFLDKTKGIIVDTTPLGDPKVDHFLALAVDENRPWHPKLSIVSLQVALPWGGVTLELDVAKVSFWVEDDLSDNIEISLEQLLTQVYHASKRNNSSLLEAIAGKLHQLDWLPSVTANFEPPVSQLFDICDRVLKGNLGHHLVLLRGLEKEGWTVTFDNGFRLNQQRADQWYSKISAAGAARNKVKSKTNLKDKSNRQIASDNNWFELEVGVKIKDQSVNLMPYIIKALQQGWWDLSLPDELAPQNLILTLEDGSRLELNYLRVKNILNTLLELYESKPLTKKQQLRLPSNQFSRLLNLQQQIGANLEWQQTDWLKQKAQSLASGSGISRQRVPQNVNAQLRSYQQDGLDWLQFLARENLGGILADDMGLGKTLQTLAHIQLQKNSGRMKGPCMVVAPTSLLGNWFNEAQKFTPDLKLVYWAGANRHQSIDQLVQADLIITSYGLLLRDSLLLRQQSIHLLILDEAQAIKNSRSQIAKTAFTFDAQHKLCLTGTPLENHLGELWSLFHFLMPGFLGDEAQFKRLFRMPIEKLQDTTRQQELARRVTPFMLRRTKDKVAADLPSKTIIEELIDLEESQADLYETVRLSMFEEVQKAVLNSGAGRNQLLISNAILRLRQICCHPKLLNGVLKPASDDLADELASELTQTEFAQGDLFDQMAVSPANQPILANPIRLAEPLPPPADIDALSNKAQSAKLRWLETTLPEMLENGRKVLIFSSFTSMLALIEKSLKKMAISHLKLTGQTRQRSELVDQFQNGVAPVFLISLKAGGAGLNLTEADTVIHFDPWWNPAAENQASDRAHRIGQDKPVFVYKLITKGTVEERINQMQQQKAQLANQLYSNNQKLTTSERPDWQLLLAPLEE